MLFWKKGREEEGKQGRNWLVLHLPTCLRAMNKTRDAGAFWATACLSREQRAGLGLSASEGSITLRYNLARSSSGAVHLGLQTRMFAYRSQVILSPSGVFWGSKINLGASPLLTPPSLSGFDLLSQALEVKPRLVPGRVLREGDMEYTASGSAAPPPCPERQSESAGSPWQCQQTDGWVSRIPHSVWSAVCCLIHFLLDTEP